MDQLGVDISKRSSVVGDYKNGKLEKEFLMENNKNGQNYLVKYLNELEEGEVIFECRGMY